MTRFGSYYMFWLQPISTRYLSCSTYTCMYHCYAGWVYTIQLRVAVEAVISQQISDCWNHPITLFVVKYIYSELQGIIKNVNNDRPNLLLCLVFTRRRKIEAITCSGGLTLLQSLFRILTDFDDEESCLIKVGKLRRWTLIFLMVPLIFISWVYLHSIPNI